MAHVDFLNIEKDSIVISVDITESLKESELTTILEGIADLPVHPDGGYRLGDAKVWFSGGSSFSSDEK